jgi:hypothetical protein
VGIWLSGGFLSEPTLIAIAYAIEQLLDARSRPRFLGHVPPEPPDAGLCASSAGVQEATRIDRREVRGALLRPSF